VRGCKGKKTAEKKKKRQKKTIRKDGEVSEKLPTKRVLGAGWINKRGGRRGLGLGGRKSLKAGGNEGGDITTPKKKKDKNNLSRKKERK